MKAGKTHLIYENPLPQLKSRQALFPSLAEVKPGRLIASFAIGEAFESVDLSTYISLSDDGGATWGAPHRVLDKTNDSVPTSDFGKLTVMPDGKIMLFGYAYLRPDPSLPMGNPETGGLLDDYIFYAISKDGGKTFSEPKKADCAWGPHVEASAPLTVLRDGTWISPITGFPDWSGKMTGKMCGRALRSTDSGKSWNDDAVCMDFGDRAVTCYEQRICELESGKLVCIGWNEDVDEGVLLNNHYTVSTDGGKTWSEPRDTGVRGQASSVCAIGGDKLLALHSMRRHTDRPGILARVIDASCGEWRVIDEEIVWEPATPLIKNDKMADIFAFLKFGQPSAIKLSSGEIMMIHWFMENGQYNVGVTKIDL